MKYIIDVSRDRVSKNGKLQLLCEIENSLPQYVHTAVDAEPYTEPDRKAIEDEVWELAYYMCKMGVRERDLCFGFQLTTEITENLSYQEAKAKFEAWLKQEDEIHVGDEVEYPPNKVKGIVVQCHVPDVYVEVDKYAVFTGISVEYLPIEWLKKTGRVFPEVAELLKKMRGEQDE